MRFRSQLGFYNLSRRQYGRSERYNLLDFARIADTDSISALVSIYNKNNILIGTIRGDVETPIIDKIEFIIDAKGCRGGKLVLSKQPNFFIQPFAIVRFFLYGNPRPVYTGYLKSPERTGSRKTYEYGLQGLIFRLKDLSLEGVDIPDSLSAKDSSNQPIPSSFAAGTNISDIVSWIVENVVIKNIPVVFDSREIIIGERITTTNFIVGKDSVSKVFDTLAILANYDWGIDVAGVFYFRPKNSSEVKRALIEGYKSGEFSVKENTDRIVNKWTVTRKTGGVGGWSIGAIANDETSIARFGRKEKSYQVPGFFDVDDCEVIASGLLAQSKDPSSYVKIKNYVLTSRNDVLEPGFYLSLIHI